MRVPLSSDRLRGLIIGVVLVMIATTGAVVAMWSHDDPATPLSPADVVRDYVRAYADQDAATACALVDLAHGPKTQCVKELRYSFAWYGHRHRAWRDVRLTSVRVSPARGWIRAEVRLRYRPARGGVSKAAFDTWWLRRSAVGTARIVRAAILDSAFFGTPDGLAGSDRPLTPAEAARPARLLPVITCGATRRVIRPQTGPVRDAYRRPVAANWIALRDVDQARTPEGATCLRLRTKSPWRPSTLIALSIATRSRASRSVDVTIRIGSGGRLTQSNNPGEAVAIGASHGDVAVVLPASLGHRLRVLVGTRSDQIEEPLLRHPSTAWQRAAPFDVNDARDDRRPSRPPPATSSLGSA